MAIFLTATYNIALVKRNFGVSCILTWDLLKEFYGKPSKLLESKYQPLTTGTINSFVYTNI